jgi:raffinose/stachyose/melibiose transport system permease protein
MEVAPPIKNDRKVQLGSGLTNRLGDKLVIFFFLLPAFALFTVFLAYPIIKSFYYSFFDWAGFGPADVFVKLDNFTRILADPVFTKAMINCLIIVGLSLAVQLPFSLGLAMLVGRGLRGRAIFRTIFFMPYVLSEVITSAIWLILLNPMPERGFINAVLTLIPGVDPVLWLADPNLVMFSIFVVLTWKYFGLHLLLYMAGLQNIPKDIEEAAVIDGANKGQLFFSIILPLLSSTIRTSVYLSVLGSLQQFALIWIMTRGGPVNSSEVMATYMYRYSFVRFDLGYGSAVAIILLAVSLVFSIIYLRAFSQRDYLSGI